MDKLDLHARRKHQAKLAQVVQNFFVKAALIVAGARTSRGTSAAGGTSPGASSPGADKPNRWFNLVAPTSQSLVGVDLAQWKELMPELCPPMILEVCLDLRGLAPHEVLEALDDTGSAHPVHRRNKQEVVLERWLVEFDAGDGDEVELPLVYKQAIVLFRCLYALVRLMPCAQLVRANALRVHTKVVDGRRTISSKGRIGLSKPLWESKADDHMGHKAFKPVATPVGTLRVLVAFRTQARFVLETTESARAHEDVREHTGAVREKSLSPTTGAAEGKKVGGIGKEEGGREGGREGAHGADPKQTARHEHGGKEEVREEAREGAEPRPRRESFRREGSGPVRSSDAIDRRSREGNPHVIAVAGRRSSEGPELVPMAPHPSLGHDHPHQPHSVLNNATSQPIAMRLPIQPFRIGSMSTSPPLASLATPPAMERRVLIALNRLNALLAAMLRQQRNSQLLATLGIPIAAVPRLVSSHHPIETPDLLANNTPRFSLLFGLRTRRLSRPQDLLLGTLAGLASLTPGLGLYLDGDSDDISGFVRMIDSKSELRFGAPLTLADPLNKFASLRAHHAQLSDSVNLLYSLRKLLNHSHNSHLPPGSYPEASQFPLITARLDGHTEEPTPVPLPPAAAPAPVVAGLATTPRHIHYENVFEDDDGDDGDDAALQVSKRAVSRGDDDDDLLFTMSDMNLAQSKN